MICKNCNHKIHKRTFIQQGQSMWNWVHTEGGNYCKVKEYDKDYPYGKNCFCHNAEPKDKLNEKEKKND